LEKETGGKMFVGTYRPTFGRFEHPMSMLATVGLSTRRWRQVVKCSLDTYKPTGFLPKDHDDDDDDDRYMLQSRPNGKDIVIKSTINCRKAIPKVGPFRKN